ncbi:O-methyltransferase [Spirosoma sp. KNUC1025]|uniref:O-methyltransferase n=1 Tax=Spirosoma sp. KNUC1025 TaxID=2894082 RepID=UPI00386BBA76|nr:class I SAM-dependent methyltransferase [Spirosoma sp. KNUC1025]
MIEIWRDKVIKDKPPIIEHIDSQSDLAGFNQPSDDLSGAFLQVLVASKPNGNFLELGTGAGRATAWILQGMDKGSRLTTVESDAELVHIARSALSNDSRLEIIQEVGETVLERLVPASFDLVFADTWPGKYNHLEEALRLVKIGGFYVIDDMLPQPNWPEGHDLKVNNLLQTLQEDSRFKLVYMEWASGLILLVRIN